MAALYRYDAVGTARGQAFREWPLPAGRVIAEQTQLAWFYAAATIFVALVAAAWQLTARGNLFARMTLVAHLPFALLAMGTAYAFIPSEGLGVFGWLKALVVVQVTVAATGFVAAWVLRQQSFDAPLAPQRFRTRLIGRRRIIVVALAIYAAVNAFFTLLFALSAGPVVLLFSIVSLLGFLGAPPLLLGLTAAINAIDPVSQTIDDSKMGSARRNLFLAVAAFVLSFVVLYATWDGVALILGPIQLGLVLTSLANLLSLNRFNNKNRPAPHEAEPAGEVLPG